MRWECEGQVAQKSWRKLRQVVSGEVYANPAAHTSWPQHRSAHVLGQGEARLSLNERLSSGRSQSEIPQIERYSQCTLEESQFVIENWGGFGDNVVEHGQAHGDKL